jgi:phosphate transport system protein
MGKHLKNAIDNLMEMLMNLSGKVEQNVSMAFDALKNMNAGIAKEVIDNDVNIDKEEIIIEEECLKILAIHQPVASDLRYIIAALKINNEIERIGDLAQDISGHILALINFLQKKNIIDFNPMYNTVLYMLKKSIDSMVNMDKEMALDVIRKDDYVDNKNREICLEISKYIKEDPINTDYYLQNIYISKRLERIADLATNIAEDTIYLVSGEIVRHDKNIY